MDEINPQIILDKIGLSINSIPDETQWPSTYSQLETLIKQYLRENKNLGQTLNLGLEEMQKIEEQINNRELFIRAIFNASPDLILTLNHVGEIIELNHNFIKFLKLSQEELLGQSIFKFIKGGLFVKNLSSIFADELQNKNSSFLGSLKESTIIIDDQKEYPISYFASKVVDQKSTIYPIYIRDLTDQKAIEKELEESRAQILVSSKMSALGEMAGGVAHEINTPLSIIQMRTEQILDDLKTDSLEKESAIRALEAIEKTVHRISKIVSSLRQFARDGRKDPTSPYPIMKIFEETLSLCQEKFANHGIKISSIIENPNLEITCRPTEITQVLLNLLNNSYDAISNLEEKWVSIEVLNFTDEIQIHVTDSGPGLPPEIQNKIMQPFFTTKELGKGTGLGLSISKGIIESHNGTLSIDSNSKNTKFIITLPKKAE